MPRRLASVSLLVAALGLPAGPAPAIARPGADPTALPAQPEAVRQQMFSLIDPAQLNPLMASKEYQQVRQRIDQAEAIPDKSAYETFILNRLRVALAAADGDAAMATAALEAVISSGRLAPAERGLFIRALASYHYNARDYQKAISRFEQYQQETGELGNLRPYLIRAYYFSRDYTRARQELLADLQADEQAGRAPAIEQLQMLANTGSKTGDAGTYRRALEKLVEFYPSDLYWSALLSQAQEGAAGAARLRLDLLRLEHAALRVLTPEKYAELAELALRAGLPSEARQAIEAGYAAGALGTGPHAQQHQKLRERAARAAPLHRAPAQDIDLMRKGIAKGGQPHPEEATLRLGAALALAGRGDEANEALRALAGGNGGAAELARYWMLWLKRPAAPAP